MPQTIKYTKPKIKKLCDEMIQVMNDNPQVLFLHRLTTMMSQKDFTVDVAYQLTTRSDEFKRVWSFCKKELECRIAEAGMSRDADSGMSKFCLSANYGWKEKSEVTSIESVETLPEFGD